MIDQKLIFDCETHVTSFASLENCGAEKFIKTLQDVAIFQSAHRQVFDKRFQEPPIDISEQLIREMDRHGVSQAIVQVGMGTAGDDFIAACANKHPDRLVGLARIRGRGEKAAQEIEHAIKNLHLKGVGETNLAAYYPMAPHEIHRSPDFTPIMDMVAKLKVPICFHTGLNHAGGSRFSQLYSDPLYIDDIAGRYPDVKIILNHMGGEYVRFFEGALMVAERNTNAYLLASKSTPEFVAKAVRTIGDDRVLFGSDWDSLMRYIIEPFDYYTQMLKAVKEASLTSAEKEKILYTNGKNLFGS